MRLVPHLTAKPPYTWRRRVRAGEGSRYRVSGIQPCQTMWLARQIEPSLAKSVMPDDAPQRLLNQPWYCARPLQPRPLQRPAASLFEAFAQAIPNPYPTQTQPRWYTDTIRYQSDIQLITCCEHGAPLEFAGHIGLPKRVSRTFNALIDVDCWWLSPDSLPQLPRLTYR